MDDKLGNPQPKRLLQHLVVLDPVGASLSALDVTVLECELDRALVLAHAVVNDQTRLGPRVAKAERKVEVVERSLRLLVVRALGEKVEQRLVVGRGNRGRVEGDEQVVDHRIAVALAEDDVLEVADRMSGARCRPGRGRWRVLQVGMLLEERRDEPPR